VEDSEEVGSGLSRRCFFACGRNDRCSGTHERPGFLGHGSEERIGADAVRLTPAELSAFNADLTHTPVHGARLPQGVLSLSGVEAPEKRA
jgi:hypothetical protein